MNPGNIQNGFVAANDNDSAEHLVYTLDSYTGGTVDNATNWLYLSGLDSGAVIESNIQLKGRQYLHAGDYRLAFEAGTYTP